MNGFEDDDKGGGCGTQTVGINVTFACLCCPAHPALRSMYDSFLLKMHPEDFATVLHLQDLLDSFF